MKKQAPDITLKDYLLTIMNERDRRYDSRFHDSEEAVRTAMTAQEKAVMAAFLASEKAVLKQEEAQTAYNVVHNDLARKMDEQNKATIPRPEIETKFSSVERDLKELREFKANLQGRFLVIGIGVTLFTLLINIAVSVILKFV